MIIKEKTSLPENVEFIKVVVDIEKGILSMDCEFHIDCAEELVKDGSEFKNLWGANIFPFKKFIEYTSMINIRPKIGNRSMEIQDEKIKEKVRQIIKNFLTY